SYTMVILRVITPSKEGLILCCLTGRHLPHGSGTEPQQFGLATPSSVQTVYPLWVKSGRTALKLRCPKADIKRRLLNERPLRARSGHSRNSFGTSESAARLGALGLVSSGCPRPSKIGLRVAHRVRPAYRSPPRSRLRSSAGCTALRAPLVRSWLRPTQTLRFGASRATLRATLIFFAVRFVFDRSLFAFGFWAIGLPRDFT